MKIYIIWTGCYSDRHIVKICSKREDAENFIGKCRDDSYDDDYLSITEHEVDELSDNSIGWEITRQPFLLDNDLFSDRLHEENKDLNFGDIFWTATRIDSYMFDQCRDNAIVIYKTTSWRDSVKEKIENSDLDNTYVFYLLAPTKEAALKIAHERYMAVKVAEDNRIVKLNKLYKFPSYVELPNG